MKGFDEGKAGMIGGKSGAMPRKINPNRLTRTLPMSKSVPQVRMQRGPSMNLGDTEGLHPRSKKTAAPKLSGSEYAAPSVSSSTPGFSGGGMVQSCAKGGAVAGVPHLSTKVTGKDWC